MYITLQVLVHHIVCGLTAQSAESGVALIAYPNYSWQTITLWAFLLINQSYFMALFFFFSGYFSPRSLDKKGIALFLHERFIRLGLPFTIYSFLVGTWLGVAIKNALLTGGTYSYDFTTNGPTQNDTTWFLAQLLLFSVLYAVLCGKGWKPKWKYPGVLFLMLVVGLGVGVVSTAMSLGIPGECA